MSSGMAAWAIAVMYQLWSRRRVETRRRAREHLPRIGVGYRVVMFDKNHRFAQRPGDLSDRLLDLPVRNGVAVLVHDAQGPLNWEGQRQQCQQELAVVAALAENAEHLLADEQRAQRHLVVVAAREGRRRGLCGPQRPDRPPTPRGRRRRDGLSPSSCGDRTDGQGCSCVATPEQADRVRLPHRRQVLQEFHQSPLVPHPGGLHV